MSIGWVIHPGGPLGRSTPASNSSELSIQIRATLPRGGKADEATGGPTDPLESSETRLPCKERHRSRQIWLELCQTTASARLGMSSAKVSLNAASTCSMPVEMTPSAIFGELAQLRLILVALWWTLSGVFRLLALQTHPNPAAPMNWRGNMYASNILEVISGFIVAPTRFTCSKRIPQVGRSSLTDVGQHRPDLDRSSSSLANFGQSRAQTSSMLAKPSVGRILQTWAQVGPTFAKARPCCLETHGARKSGQVGQSLERSLPSYGGGVLRVGPAPRRMPRP